MTMAIVRKAISDPTLDKLILKERASAKQRKPKPVAIGSALIISEDELGIYNDPYARAVSGQDRSTQRKRPRDVGMLNRHSRA